MSNTFNVQFVGDYFAMNVCVTEVDGDDEVAINLATNIIKRHYGWDVLQASTIEVYAIQEN